MDLTFEPPKGKPFSIEIGFFDTVLEIKEKIEKYHGVPVSRQTLIYNDTVLQDDRDVAYCDLYNDSRLQLIIAPEPDNSSGANAENVSPASKIRLAIKIANSKAQFALEMDLNDTVAKLKEKIQERESVPGNHRLALHWPTGTELLDGRSLRECEINDNSEIEVSFRPLPSPVASASPSKKLKVMVKSKCGTKKIPVEVNPTDNVAELRRELQRMQARTQLQLPTDYFFIYKQNVMEDERSFRWHQVGQGDTIEIFNGSVTGGGS